jgi:hypothetical protein
MKQDLNGYYLTNEELEYYLSLKQQAEDYLNVLLRKKRAEAITYN